MVNFLPYSSSNTLVLSFSFVKLCCISSASLSILKIIMPSVLIYMNFTHYIKGLESRVFNMAFYEISGLSIWPA